MSSSPKRYAPKLYALGRIALGEELISQQDTRGFYQLIIAAITAAIGFVIAFATLIFGWSAFTVDIRLLCMLSISTYGLVIPIYRFLPNYSRLASNLIPASLVVTCSYGIFKTAGVVPVAPLYAAAVPLITIMICRPSDAYAWTGVMVMALIGGMFATPGAGIETPPGWIVLAASLSLLLAAFVSLRLQRAVWDGALDGEQQANRELRVEYSRQRQRDQQLHDQERVESLRLMAGGVAHDFNNFLAAIAGNMTLLDLELKKPEPDSARTSAHFKEVARAVEDAGGLARKLLDYTGHRHQTLLHFEVSERLATDVALAQASVGVGTQINVDADTELWIEGDPIQFDQVIVNLLINAAQAYGAKSGQVDVALSSVAVKDALRSDAGMGVIKPGDYIQVTVRDFGHGIEPAYMEQMFDPFFTTKGEGSGIGLASVRGIVQAHGGGIRVDSTLGKGTTMTVYFPEGIAHSTQDRVVEVDIAPSVGHNNSILVVDDQAPVRKVVGALVESFGMEAQFAVNGQEAVERSSKHDFAAIILDVAMPVLDGIATVTQIRQASIHQPIVLISGYATENTAELCRNDAAIRVLQKPFSADALRSALSELSVLDTVQSAAG